MADTNTSDAEDRRPEEALVSRGGADWQLLDGLPGDTRLTVVDCHI